MIKKHFISFIVSIQIFLFLICVNSFAGTTGKIAGKVIDATNGEPIIGANIIIVGTSLGAAADIDGNFFSMNNALNVLKLFFNPSLIRDFFIGDFIFGSLKNKNNGIENTIKKADATKNVSLIRS